MKQDHDKAKSPEPIEAWLGRFVASYRSRFSSLLAAPGRIVRSDMDYRSPLQIEVLQTRDPFFQILLQSHFDNRNDTEFIVHPPAVLADLPATIDECLRQERWQRRIRDDEQRYVSAEFPIETLADALTASLLNWVQHLLYTRIEQAVRPPGLYSFAGVAGPLAVAVYVGNIAEQDVDDTLRQMESQLVIPVGPVTNVSPSGIEASRRKSPPFEAFAVHFFPPIVVGEPLKPTGFADALSSQYKTKLWEIAASVEIGTRAVRIRRDGVVFVYTRDQDEAFRIFNALFAAGVLLDVPSGYPFHAVRKPELAEANLDLATGRLSGYSVPVQSLRTLQMREVFAPWLVTLAERRRLPASELENVLSLAKVIYENRTYRAACTLLSEAQTHVRESDYVQGFLTSWTLIERLLYDDWGAYLLAGSPPPSKERRKMALSGKEWDVAAVTRGLFAGGKIDKSLFERLDHLRTRRNGIVHRGEQVNLHDAEECYQLAFSLLRPRVVTAPAMV